MAFADLVSAADRAIQGHLGSVKVIYRPEPELGDPVIVDGMFDASFVFLDQGEAGVESVGPVVFLLLVDLPVHPEDCNPRITINGVDYKVRERQVDSLGGIKLFLHLEDE